MDYSLPVLLELDILGELLGQVGEEYWLWSQVNMEYK